MHRRAGEQSPIEDGVSENRGRRRGGGGGGDGVRKQFLIHFLSGGGGGGGESTAAFTSAFAYLNFQIESDKVIIHFLFGATTATGDATSVRIPLLPKRSTFRAQLR